jgi:hypothetical protein
MKHTRTRDLPFSLCLKHTHATFPLLPHMVVIKLIYRRDNYSYSLTIIILTPVKMKFFFTFGILLSDVSQHRGQPPSLD